MWQRIATPPAYAQSSAKTDAWSETPCSSFQLNLRDDTPIECGYVTVPLRHADPDGPTIRLAVVVLPAVDADPAADPLFMAQGGPGASTIDTFAEYLATDNDLRPTTNRDIVLWDQRGTLYSSPFLHCPEVLNADLQSVLADATPPKSFWQ